MSRRLLLCLPFLCALIVLPAAEARSTAPGPRQPPRPKPERTDAELFAKAARIQARMWKHISPEGLLVYVHPQGASPDVLSHEALKLADVAIWTGAYAAAQACRWHVTRDPDALAQVRVLTKGLALLSEATGTPGALARNVGRKLPDQPLPKECVASSARPGLYFRSDVSRDQLAGVVMGLGVIHRLVEDPAIRDLARERLAQIAIRIKQDGMSLRDWRGKKTKHGDLGKGVDPLGVVSNGQSAAIAYATFVAADAAGGGALCRTCLRDVQRDGYRDAMVQQHTGIRQHLSASNVNMTCMALATTAFLASDGTSRRNARSALMQLRRATRGWWNGGHCACHILADLRYDRRATLDELRVVLHTLTEEEIPPRDFIVREISRAATAPERHPSHWSWKSLATKVRIKTAGSPPHPTISHTRADWLFAYWLARGVGQLKPRSGPGAVAGPVVLGIQTPAWALAYGADMRGR